MRIAVAVAYSASVPTAARTDAAKEETGDNSLNTTHWDNSFVFGAAACIDLNASTYQGYNTAISSFFMLFSIFLLVVEQWTSTTVAAQVGSPPKQPRLSASHKEEIQTHSQHP